MSMYYCKKTRRQFLVGSGKTLLALPLLPSLMPVEAFAQAATPPKRLMMFWFDHGNLNAMWPARSLATTAVGSSGSKEVLLRSLGSTSSFSSVLNNPLYDTLKNSDQLTIVRGLDASVRWGSAHGNFPVASAQDRNSEGGFPSIESVLESSKTLYPDSTPAYVRKAIRVGLLGAGLFYQKVGSGVQVIPHYEDWTIRNFYNEVFGSLTAGTTAPADNTNELKSNILNRVFGAYTGFKNSRKISAEDKARLEQHMGYISDLQKSLGQVAPTPTCSKPADPGSVSDPALCNRIYLDLLAVAFKCGLTKVGVMAFEGQDPQWIPGLSGLGTNVHDAMHGSAGNAIQKTAYEVWWRYFTNLIADRFLAPLNVEEGVTGRTYLENMVTAMLCAGGMQDLGGDNGHSGYDSQQVLIGNMGGALRSGRYVTMPSAGLPYNCFLITLLQLMGVPPSDYAFATPNGQGFGYYGEFPANHVLKGRFYQPISEILT
ncbi:DUF1552 domain-containing protein [Bdellovibrio bacteriovorus]|uniref:DUF1552 domain-containing protein n=1 Tax=Bdellovibrio bacteriovorus (strain ATCC 15356 / DSM 50701 / NCIMB 9529 / HD100) TaxID=264462 RepID=Q6MQ14_BDEBA|nr:DUF1552 domain-containing protein [Bdellovibrio bacteriovorus]CAE78633.1 hypothetical protein predicted by Glimmer/Critica [Bdellovibrio bacteriovorus HD100]